MYEKTRAAQLQRMYGKSFKVLRVFRIEDIEIVKLQDCRTRFNDIYYTDDSTSHLHVTVTQALQSAINAHNR